MKKLLTLVAFITAARGASAMASEPTKLLCQSQQGEPSIVVTIDYAAGTVDGIAATFTDDQISYLTTYVDSRDGKKYQTAHVLNRMDGTYWVGPAYVATTNPPLQYLCSAAPARRF